MKILMTSDTFLPLVGGGEIHVKELCENLTRLGHQVTLVTNQKGVGEDHFAFRVIRIQWKKSNLSRLFRTLYHEAKEADLVHLHYSYRLSAIAAIAGRLRGKRVIETLHGLGTLNEAKARFPYKQIHALYRFLALNLATRIISTSEDIAIVARQHMLRPNSIEIIFNGLNTQIFNLSLKVPEELSKKYVGKKVILTVRRLVPKNGIHFLVESMPEIVKLIPNAYYVMIGSGRMESYIKKRVVELGLESHIDMLGEVNNSEVPAYMKLADVVVFPSTAESSSIACAEAMSMGKIVVASRVGGLVELLGAKGERGILVQLVDWQGSNYDAPIQLPSGRYTALAKAVADAILLDQSGRTKQAAKYAKDELDWVVVADKTIRVYEKASLNMRGKEIKDFYTNYGDRITTKRLYSKYSLRSYIHRQQYKSVLSFVESSMKVLDAGCGEGTLSIMMAQKGAIVTACDLSGPNIDASRRYALENKIGDKIEFLIGDAEKLPFPDNSFDLVVSSHVLEHLPDFDQGFKEIMRVTKKRAVIAIPTVLNPCSWVQVGKGWFYLKGLRSFAALPFGFLKMLWALLAFEEGVDEFYAGANVPHVFRFPFVMKKKIKKSGFHLIQYEASSVCLPYFEFLLPLVKFLDKYKSKPFLRNCGYGTTFIIEKY